MLYEAQAFDYTESLAKNAIGGAQPKQETCMSQNPLSARPRGIKRQIPRHLGLIIFLFDAVLLACAFLITKYSAQFVIFVTDYFGWDTDFNHFDTRRYYYLFLCACILLRFAVKGHYSRRLPWLGQMEGILKTIGFVLLFDGFNHYFFYGLTFPFLIIFNWTLCALLLVVGRYAALHAVRLFKEWKLPVVLVGDDRMIMDSCYAFLADGMTGYDIKVVLLTNQSDPSFDLNFLPKSHGEVQLVKSQESFGDFIESHLGYYYIFSMDELRGPHKDRLIKALEISQVEYGVIPHTKDLDIYGMEPHYFFGNDVMILHRRDKIRSPSGRIIKRLIDITVSFFAVIVLGILTAVVWAMKKIEKSKTPVFYGGKRVGMNGELFHCWKFCTMRSDGDSILNELLENDPVKRAEWDKFQKLKDDPRIDSKISKILRKTSLDELPQLWNVFVGDMSLVGPRPILENQKEEYGEMIEQYYAVRPGLSGLWQVSGRNETSFQQRVYWDGWYIRNWSLWYDIVIILKTARVLITGSGAY